ncbi:MAG: pyridoxamine 5'-phosphate oxidase family protein [Bacteroidales bacterium]|jgi:nitroimidazol reductase NimA-like FMN-containing flavoprotein (pyridoxamine 5'-phosphate oxidase superfamily)|nr:pyridoxamine 5'-phosphate oxidase family protein [Bacteroidales bacterium]
MRRTIWITEDEQINEVIKSADTCSLAMVDENGKPYVILMNFGYKDGVFYFHSDPKGKKIDCLKRNPSVSIALSTNHRYFHQNENVACSYGLSYRSLYAQGEIKFIEDKEQKIEALKIFMKQYSDKDFTFSDPAVNNVIVFILKPKELKCKQYGKL